VIRIGWYEVKALYCTELLSDGFSYVPHGLDITASVSPPNTFAIVID